MNWLDVTESESTDNMPTSRVQSNSVQEPLRDLYTCNRHQTDPDAGENDNETKTTSPPTNAALYGNNKSDFCKRTSYREARPLTRSPSHGYNGVTGYGSRVSGHDQLTWSTPLCRSSSIEQLLEKYAPLPPSRSSSHHSLLLGKYSSRQRDFRCPDDSVRRIGKICKTVRFSLDEDEPSTVERKPCKVDCDGDDHGVVMNCDDDDADDDNNDGDDDDDDEGFEAKDSEQYSWSERRPDVAGRAWPDALFGSARSSSDPSCSSRSLGNHRPLCRLAQSRIDFLMPRLATANIRDQLAELGLTDVDNARRPNADNCDGGVDDPERLASTKADVSWQSSSADSAVADLQMNLSLVKHVSQLPCVVISDHSQFEQPGIDGVRSADDQTMLFTGVEHKLSTSSLTSDYSDSGQSFNSDTSLSFDDDDVSPLIRDKPVSCLFQFYY